MYPLRFRVRIAVLERPGQAVGQTHWVEMSERIEALVNIDWASMYYALGIPVSAYTPIFAVSRTSGWTAHVLEQR